MAIAEQAQIPGMTQEQYDSMARELLPRLKKTPGFIAHAGGPIQGGWQVIEFWETREQYDAWMKEVITPAMQQSGGAQPNITIFEVHTVVVP